MTYVPHVGVATGSGWIARRERALLYLPDDPAGGPPNGLAERFLAFDDDTLADAFTRHVLDAGDTVPPFVYIEWPNSRERSRIQVIVRGDVELTSDLDSMPSLSGAGSSTWVEHRALRDPHTARFRCGTSAESDTDLRAGIVLAGGFELELSAHVPEHIDRSPVVVEDHSAPTPQAARRPTPDAPADADDGTAPVEPAAPTTSGIDALAAAVGADWADESSPPDPHSSRANEPPAAPVLVGDVTPATERVDKTPLDESTMVEGDIPLARVGVSANVDFGDRPPIALSEDLVVGRLPTLSGARREIGRLETIADAPHVSRTHCVIAVEAGRISVTDCGSTGGTVVLATDSEEPTVLQPWHRHEVDIGATIFLGGATAVRLTAPRPEPS